MTLLRGTPFRLTAAAIAVLAAAPLVTACKSANAALDCGKRAISITGDVQDLMDSSVNVGQITDDDKRRHTRAAFQKIRDDTHRIRESSGNSKMNQATDKLSKAVDSAVTEVDNGRKPDLGAVSSAAGAVTEACGSS
ncbi:hypothetical protein [Kitasatospora sp. LaBMicrA B282]|uniref:hypothetical protein n=1 Tax=Kitasatospora sp. LaBMicrA B282 TaxID=3420949 RepID=UPI003D0FF9A8